MVIGIPSEVKQNENRVALTPAGVRMVTAQQHTVVVQSNAGIYAGFEDEAYRAAGATIADTGADVYASADMILKVKEPQPEEFPFIRNNQILFTYLHLANEPRLANVLLEQNVIGIAYETVQTESGKLPLLRPMSEIAGRMSVQIGARFLENHFGGNGIVLGGVPGVSPGTVVIIGGGVVGTNAAKIAIGMGAQVVVLDSNPERLAYLDDIFGGRITTIAASPYSIEQYCAQADLLIGAVLIPGARAPKVVTEPMVQGMAKGSVIVDVAIDQGGSVETIDRITTHDAPTFCKHGVIHYCVANIPGSVAKTSTLALTNVTMPYVLKLAGQGWKRAIDGDSSLRKGLNVANGKVTHKAVAEALSLPYDNVNAG